MNTVFKHNEGGSAPVERPLQAAHKQHPAPTADDTAELPWQPNSSPSPWQPAQIESHHRSEVSVSMATEQMSGNPSLFVNSENRMGGGGASLVT